MAAFAYLDFDLRFRKQRDGYRVELVQSSGDRVEHAFQLPFNEHELENYLLKIGQRRSGTRRSSSPEAEAAREFGSRMFDALFEGEMNVRFRQSLEEAKRQKSGLRLRLNLSDTPELADLPWEYLYHTQPRQFLALSAETPIVRYLDLPDLMKPLEVVPPLRALVMISSPVDFDPLDVDREWQKLREAVSDLEGRGLLVVDRLDKATLPELQRRLRRADYHIFHFIGHGGFNPNTQEGVLVLEDENGRGRLVSGESIGVYLRDEQTLRLVILNACEGGRGARQDAFAGTAQSLVLKNIPAVIAMQFEVTDDAAITMAHEFYSALADGYAVDAALAEARKAMFARGSTVEWGTPVLFLRAANGRIFNVDRSNARNSARQEPAERIRAGNDVTKKEGPCARSTDEAGSRADARPGSNTPSKPPPLLPSDRVKRGATTDFQPASPPLRREVHSAPGRTSRRGLIWGAVVAGLLLLTSVVGVVIWQAVQEDVDWEPYLSAQGIVPADFDLDAYTPSIHDELDDRDLDLPDIGMPAGQNFQPRGGWLMRVRGGMNIDNRLQFAANGRFSGSSSSAGVTWDAVAVSGNWSYDPGTSMLHMTFNTGHWIHIQLLNAEGGFRSTLFLGFVRYDYEFIQL
jgi:hypothetical protein